ncbi:MAG: Ig-like domain-containing protein, partial [Pseudohongiellaceae bacterium]
MQYISDWLLKAMSMRRALFRLPAVFAAYALSLAVPLLLAFAPQVQAQFPAFSSVPELDLLRSSDTGNPTDNNTSIGTPVFSVGNLESGGTVTVTATWNDAPGGSAYDNISKSFVVPAGVRVILVGFGSDSTSDPGPGGQCRLNSGANLGILTNNCSLHSAARAALGSYTVHAVQSSRGNPGLSSNQTFIPQTSATVNLTISESPPATPDAVTSPSLTVQVLGNGSGQVAVFELLNFGTEFDSMAGGVITMTDTFDFGTKSFFSYIAVAQPDAGHTLSARDCAVVGGSFAVSFRNPPIANAVIAAGTLGVAQSALVADNACHIGLSEETTNTDQTIAFTFTDPNAPVLPVVSIRADAVGVSEGTDATFTITAARGQINRPELIVNLTVTDSGSFISGTPPDSVTIVEGSNEAILTITTDDDSEDEPNGAITVDIASGDDYDLGTTGTSARIEIDDNDEPTPPHITIDYDARVNAGKMCAASLITNKAGICEGDTLIFTLSADPVPDSDLSVRLGRLEAGISGLNYGLTSPGNYVPEADDRGNYTVTIAANTSSITYEIDTTNHYGSNSLGGYYLEVVCVNQPDNDGVAGNNSFECLTDDTIDTDYTFVATSRGNQSAGALTPANSHCDGGAGNDGDESSECLVHIHPVIASVISVAAVSTGAVAEGGNAEFSIATNRAPNHYNAGRTALANLPISIAIGEAGDVTDAASPMLVNIPAAGSTANFSISLSDDSTGWDGATPSVSATVAASGDTPVRYIPHGISNSASVTVTDDETITVVMGADPAGVAEGDTLTFTVAASGATLEADLMLSYTTTGTATSATDYTAPSGTVTITAGTSTANITVVTLADNETDAGETVIITLTDPGLTTVNLGGNTAATGMIANDAPFSNPTLSVAGDGAVFEGRDAVFTITANGPPANELTVAVTVANVTGMGDFLGANAPTSVTLPNTAATWTVSVPTKDSTGGDGSIATDGAITLTLTDADGYMVSTAEGANSGTVTVQDVPVITIDWDSKARPGTKTCAAAKNGTDFSGVCEGDAIIYTITSTPPPAADMSVEIERCSAGGCDALGLTSPYSYGPADQDRIELEITAGTASITYERVMSNEYGAQNDGGYLVEIACRDGSNGTNAAGTCPPYPGGFLSTIAPAYRFTDTTESPAVGPDDNDDSEAFANVRSVAAPELTVAADNASVEQGTDAAFTITGTSVPNHYNADRTALAGLPISITVGESGASLAGTAPTMATLAVAVTTVGVSIPTQAGDAGDGNITLTLAAATGYSVGTPSSATVSVTEPVVSATPTIALAAASNSGATDDLITNDGSPTFDLGNLVADATVIVTAERADASAYRLTLVATGATGSVTFMNAHTACEFRPTTFAFTASTTCELGDETATDGTIEWTITATQQSPGEIVSTAADLGTVTIDLGAPTVTLTGDTTTELMDGETTTITATVSEASTLAADDFTVTGGTLSSFTQVTDSDTEYTAVFTAANATASPITASISVGASTFTDTAGNDNDAASNALQITVAALDQTAAPTIALADASNGGLNTDLITNDASPTFDLSDLVTNATVLVQATAGTFRYRITLTATGATDSVTFSNVPADGGCEASFDSGSGFVNYFESPNCRLVDPAAGATTEYTITATQQSPGETVSTEADPGGTLTIDVGAPGAVVLTG